jgi:hypothetical protein
MATHLYDLLEHFADCILRGRGPEINNAENALRILTLTEKALRIRPDRADHDGVTAP